MKLRGRNKVSPEFSMSSMTDIVFLLLVFFMLTSNSPNALDLLLPKAKGKSTNTQNVAISIKKNLQVYIDADRVREGQLEAKLKTKLAGKESPTVILRAEEGVPIEKVVNILDIANKNKYKIILAVRPQ